MQGRRRQNAISARALAVVFVFLGPAVAVAALLAEVEAYVLAFAMIAYACIAGPIFLAAAATSRLVNSKHRSFRLTPTCHIERKRVKRRLLWIGYLSRAAGFLAGLAAAVLTGLVLKHRMADLPGHRSWELWLLFVAPLVIAYGLAEFLAWLGLKRVFVRLGWMTREEARRFVLPTAYWPDSWLEPLDEPESAERDAPE